MENVYFVHDSFVDYQGLEHRFTVAAVIEKNPDVYVSDFTGNCECDAYARIGMGVAMCSTKDEWDSSKGEMIAEGRAKKFIDNSIIITSRAMFNIVTEDSIEELLQKEIGYIKEHPGAFISGYDEAEAKFHQDEHIASLKETLDDDEKSVIEKAAEGKLSSQFIELVGILAKRC